MLFGSFLNFLGRFPKAVTNRTKKTNPQSTWEFVRCRQDKLFDISKSYLA